MYTLPQEGGVFDAPPIVCRVCARLPPTEEQLQEAVRIARELRADGRDVPAAGFTAAERLGICPHAVLAELARHSAAARRRRAGNRGHTP